MNLHYSYEFFDSRHVFLNYNEVDKTTIHSHDFIEIAFIARGTGKHLIEGQYVTCQAGDYYIIEPGKKHQFTCTDEKLCIYNCIFTPDFIMGIPAGESFQELMTRYPFRALFVCPQWESSEAFHATAEVEILFKEMFLEYENRRAGYIQVLQADIMKLLVMTIRDVMTQKEIPACRSNEIGKVIEYLHGHYQEEISLKQLSEIACFSEGYLCRKFKEETGRNIKAYMRTIRINESKKLLLHTDEPVKEICRKVGYEDVKYFADLFRKETGISPGKFRRKK